MTTARRDIEAGERDIRAHSDTFRKELGLRDLVLTQVLFIVGLGWIGTAARLGPSHVVSVLCFIPPDQVDLIGPVAQVLDAGSRPLGLVGHIVPIVIMTITVVRVAQASVNFTGSTRLPMVAGWDHLLPQWFTRLHPRYRTPVNSIVFVGAVTLALASVVIVGVGEQEAFQLLNNASGVFYALAYLVMFALPLAGRYGTLHAASPWLKLAAASGFGMTALYISLSIFPIIQVGSALGFAAKVGLLILGANIAGVMIFAAARARRAAAQVAP